MKNPFDNMDVRSRRCAPSTTYAQVLNTFTGQCKSLSILAGVKLWPRVHVLKGNVPLLISMK